MAFGAGRSCRDHCLISSVLSQARKPRLGEAARLPLGSLLALGVGTSSFGMFLPPGALLTQRGTVAESIASSYLFRAARAPREIWRAEEWRSVPGHKVEAPFVMFLLESDQRPISSEPHCSPVLLLGHIYRAPLHTHICCLSSLLAAPPPLHLHPSLRGLHFMASRVLSRARVGPKFSSLVAPSLLSG